MNTHSKISARDCSLTQFITATILARGTGKSAALVAGERYGWTDTSVLRALMATEGATGGYLVPTDLAANEVISALTPLTVVRRATPASNVLSLPHGNLTIARVDAAPSVGFVGEDVATSEATGPEFGDITLLARKLKATKPISNDLIRFSSPEVENVVRDSLLREYAVAEDAAFLAGLGGLGPQGLRYLAATVNASSGTSNAEIISDLQALIGALTSANTPMVAPHWFMPPVLHEALLTTVATSGQFLFPSLHEGGALLGYPVSASTGMPSGTVILCDMSEFIIGQSPLVISVGAGATYTNSVGDRVGAFDKDQSVLKVTLGIDCALKHSTSAACLTGASWS